MGRLIDDSRLHVFYGLHKIRFGFPQLKVTRQKKGPNDAPCESCIEPYPEWKVSCMTRLLELPG